MVIVRAALAMGLVFLVSAAPGYAAEGDAPQAGTVAQPANASQPEKGLQVQFFVENDKWSHADQHYTNGIKLGVGVRQDTMPFLKPYEHALRKVFRLELQDELYHGLFIGQNMYTPRNIREPAPQLFDRPWAGWTYMGLVSQRLKLGSKSALVADYANSGSNPNMESKATYVPDALHTFELDIGVVGPNSRSDNVQTWWHKVVNADHPEGWANQIPNEVGFIASYVGKWRYDYSKANMGFDFIPHAGASLGTVMTFARAGGMVRYGLNKTGFGPDTIEPGGAMLQSTRAAHRRAGTGAGRKCNFQPFQSQECEWYVFAGLDMRLVAYNMFLDGTVFKDSPSVDRRPFVYDVLLGISGRVGPVRLSVTRVVRSEEFTTSQAGGGTQRFHSFNVGVEF